jgi:hypothetical protein
MGILSRGKPVANLPTLVAEAERLANVGEFAKSFNVYLKILDVIKMDSDQARRIAIHAAIVARKSGNFVAAGNLWAQVSGSFPEPTFENNARGENEGENLWLWAKLWAFVNFFEHGALGEIRAQAIQTLRLARVLNMPVAFDHMAAPSLALMFSEYEPRGHASQSEFLDFLKAVQRDVEEYPLGLSDYDQKLWLVWLERWGKVLEREFNGGGRFFSGMPSKYVKGNSPTLSIGDIVSLNWDEVRLDAENAIDCERWSEAKELLNILEIDAESGLDSDRIWVWFHLGRFANGVGDVFEASSVTVTAMSELKILCDQGYNFELELAFFILQLFYYQVKIEGLSASFKNYSRGTLREAIECLVVGDAHLDVSPETNRPSDLFKANFRQLFDLTDQVKANGDEEWARLILTDLANALPRIEHEGMRRLLSNEIRTRL